MKITRTFTAGRRRPFDGIELPHRLQRNPQPGRLGRLRDEGHMVPEALVAGRRRHPGAEVLPQGGVPAQTAPRSREDGVPEWLRRSGRRGAPPTPTRRRDRRAAGLPPPRRLLDATGAGRAATSTAEEDARAFYDEIVLHAGRADGGAELPAVVQHRPALGLRHRRARRRATSTSTRRPARSSARTSAYEHPQPHACFIQSSATTSSTTAASWTCGSARPASSSTARAPASNFSALRGEGEPLSGGGKSSGLMSFLKIGDRAAGAIKSRRHHAPRRQDGRASTSTTPTSRSSSTGRCVEEQKVAALVAGSRAAQPAPQRASSKAMPRPRRRRRTTRSTRRRTRSSRKAIRDAARALGVPENYIAARARSSRSRACTRIEVEEYDTDWNSKAYYTVCGQNSNNSVRVTNDVHETRSSDDGDWHLYWRTDGRRSSRTKPCRRWPATCGTRSPTRRGPAPTPACSSTPRSTSGTPARPTAGSTRGTRAREYMFLDDTACNLASLNLIKFYDAETGSVRHRGVPRTPSGSGRSCSEISRLHGAVPERADRAEVATTSARSASATPTSARC